MSSIDIIAKGARLDSDVITNVPLGAGLSTTYDVEVSNSDWLVIEGDLTATALADLVMTVQPFEGDGVTLSAVVLAPIAAATPAQVLSGGHAYGIAKYDVTGIGRVRIFWKNGNVGAQTLTRGSWRTQGF